MRPTIKVKALSAHVPLRRAAMSASAVSRRLFPAWISDDDAGVAFPARTASPRVRHSLVLRALSTETTANLKSLPDAHGAR